MTLALDPYSADDEIWTRWRKRLGSAIFNAGVHALCTISKLHPATNPRLRGVEVLNDVAYGSSASEAHLLDVYRPAHATGPLPAIVYVHGGSFQRLSKEVYWFVALTYARHGFVVFNVNYRLAPRNRFPAALVDVCEAVRWVTANGHRYGADPERLVLAGDSAGANLVMGVCIAASYRRAEPWCERIWSTGVKPRAAIVAGGVLHVSRREPIKYDDGVPAWIRDAVADIPGAYLPANDTSPELADPLVVLERSGPPERPLPALFAPLGSKDPFGSDTFRLRRAVQRIGGSCDVTVYDGGIHCFHVLFPWQKRSYRCWMEQIDFVRRHTGSTVHAA
jgi:acetyl esterase